MEEKQSFVGNLLKIDVQENNKEILTKWTGKSIDRNPSKFINPVLLDIVKRSNEFGKRIVLDFQNLDFMNSSTITPLIKILERAKKGKTFITVRYNKQLKWQDLSFTALKIFQTKDKRVIIKGI